MKIKTNHIIIFSSLAFSTILYVYLNYFSNIVMPWQKKEVIEKTLLWGGLIEIPKNAGFINIEKRGSIFTRQFIIEFNASKEEIKNWKNNSLRLKNNIPIIRGKTKLYEIYPGENESMGGKVEIEENNVKINISWS